MAMTELSADDPALASYADVDSDEPHKGDLLEQFYLTLTVMYLGAPAGANSVVHDGSSACSKVSIRGATPTKSSSFCASSSPSSSSRPSWTVGLPRRAH